MTQTATQPSITYRFLKPDEYPKLEEVFTSYGVTVPSVDLSKIVVAENTDGELVGFLTLQLIPHCEPIWIHEHYREEVEWRKLLEPIEEIRNGSAIFSFSDSRRVDRMLDKSGFECLSDYRVWVKRG